MKELPRSDLARLRPLVPAPAGHMTFVHAVLEARMPGRVLVDDVRAPQTALVLHGSGFLFALGRPDAAVVDAAVPDLLAREARLESAALWATSRAWEGALDHLFVARTTRKEFDRNLRRAALSPPPLPAGYRLVPIDRATAEHFGQSVDDWVVRAWGGVGPFVENALGAAVVRGDRLVSFCAACAIGGGEAEVEIGTAVGYRKRGLATAAAVAFFAACEAHGLRPAWSCAAGNTASERLARRLGFRPVRHVAGYPLRPEMERLDGRWRLPVRQVRRRRRR